MEFISLGAVGISLVFLALGLVVAWVATRHLGISEGSTILTLLLLPFLVFLIFSGQLESFKGGGFEWKLRVAGATLAVNSKLNTDLKSADLVDRIGRAESVDIQVLFSQPVDVIIVRSPAWKNLQAQQLLRPAIQVGVVIYNSLLAGSFMALVVLDDNDRPLGVFENNNFLDLLRIPFAYNRNPLSNEEIELAGDERHVQAMIKQTDLWEILRSPNAYARSRGNKAWIGERSSKLEALTEMMENRWEAAAITDVIGKYKGTLSRSVLFEDLMVGVVTPQP